jgi:Uma2 family endonuclease
MRRGKDSEPSKDRFGFVLQNRVVATCYRQLHSLAAVPSRRGRRACYTAVMTVASKPITAEELFEMGDVGRCELINGEILPMAPAGAEHGSMVIAISVPLALHVRAHRLGRVYGAETGFLIARQPDTVRAPDVAFVAGDRVPEQPRRGYFDGPPDLAVEVISPSDTMSEVKAKVEQWLAAGTVSVWVIDPPNRLVEVYRKGQPVLQYRTGDELRDEPTLSGFVLKVDQLFEEL